MITDYRTRLLIAINAAELAGYTNYAAALLAIYRKEFPAK